MKTEKTRKRKVVPGQVTIYEKPTSSKCREVKRVLAEKGVNYHVINYLEEPLPPEALALLLSLAGLRPHEALRTSEEAFRQFVAGRNLRDDELIRVMAAHLELLQRPIVVKGDKAVLARPLGRLAELGIK